MGNGILSRGQGVLNLKNRGPGKQYTVKERVPVRQWDWGAGLGGVREARPGSCLVTAHSVQPVVCLSSLGLCF